MLLLSPKVPRVKTGTFEESCVRTTSMAFVLKDQNANSNSKWTYNVYKYLLVVKWHIGLIGPTQFVHRCVFARYTQYFPKLCENNNRHITRVGFGPRPLQF